MPKKLQALFSLLLLCSFTYSLEGMVKRSKQEIQDESESGESESEEGLFNYKQEIEVLNRICNELQGENDGLKTALAKLRQNNNNQEEQILRCMYDDRVRKDLGLLADRSVLKDSNIELSEESIVYLNENGILETLAPNHTQINVKDGEKKLAELFHMPQGTFVLSCIILGIAVKTHFISYEEACALLDKPSWRAWLLQRSIEASAGAAVMLIDRPADFIACFIENVQGFSQGNYGVPLRVRMEHFFDLVKNSFDDSRFHARNKKRWYKKSFVRALRFLVGGVVMHLITEGMYRKDIMPHLPESFKYQP